MCYDSLDPLTSIPAMALAVDFNVGPLAQIGITFLSMESYHLATGAYGWYKARSRSQTLAGLLTIAGGELVPSSAFNNSAYTDSRYHHSEVKGVAVQGGHVVQISLPKASTALSDNVGLSCLRALTTSLLCFYNTQ